MIPMGWRLTTVGDVAESSATGPFGSAVSSKTFRTAGVPMIRGSNLSTDVSVRLEEAGMVFVDPEVAGRFGRSIARRGDLVFTCWGTIGQVGYVDQRARYDEYLVSNKQMRLTPDKTQVDPDFVYFALARRDSVEAMASSAIGSSVPGFNLGQLRAWPLTLPPLDEQRRIAAVLGALDDLIETSRGLGESLEAQARYVAAQASSLVPLSSLAVQASTCQVKPAGQVEHYSLPAFDRGATPDYIDGSQIQSNKLEINQPSVLVSRLNPKWERCWLVYPGEHAVASTEFVPLLGVGAQVEEVWAVTSGPSYWRQMREHVTGTTGSHQRVDKSALLDLLVPDVRLLPASVREGLVAVVRTAHQTRDEIADLTQTRDELLPLLMSGKIRVDEIEGVA